MREEIIEKLRRLLAFYACTSPDKITVTLNDEELSRDLDIAVEVNLLTWERHPLEGVTLYSDGELIVSALFRPEYDDLARDLLREIPKHVRNERDEKLWELTGELWLRENWARLERVFPKTVLFLKAIDKIADEVSRRYGVHIWVKHGVKPSTFYVVASRIFGGAATDEDMYRFAARAMEAMEHFVQAYLDLEERILARDKKTRVRTQIKNYLRETLTWDKKGLAQWQTL